MIPPLPAKQVKVNTQRNNRSSTIAMYFQSSITFDTKSKPYQVQPAPLIAGHLVVLIVVPDMLCDELNTLQCVLHLGAERTVQSS